MKKLLVATAVSLVTMAAAAYALEYAEADANGDGQVTIDEAVAAMPETSSDLIAAADTDGDGVLSAAEFEVLAKQ